MISVVIPVLDEETHIEECVRSALDQDYPHDCLEVIVADGGSRDRTREIVSTIARTDPRLILIDNPGRNQAAGLNRAIERCRGQVVARLDGHAAWYPGHIRRCVQLLEETGADNVGGTMEGMGDNPIAEAVAHAMRSPFAAGGATYRYARREQDVDTVFLGCFRREALERAGPFNEGFPPHEDYEMNRRIIRAGGRVVFSPDIPARYWARASWAGLARQYFAYGRAKARVARRYPDVMRLHHLAAPLLVAGLPLAALAGGTGVGRRVVGGATLGYVGAAAVAAAAAGRGASRGARWRLPFVFPVIHVAWGTGFWAGLVSARGT